MALNNIANEPRREITESVIGILASALWLGVAFLIAVRINPYYINGPKDYGPPWFITVSFFTFVVAIFGALLLFGGLFLTHELGEEVCGWMTALGFDPRPKRRY